MTEKVLDCPFCASKPRIDTTIEFAVEIMCINLQCEITTWVVKNNLDNAIKAWNTRK